MPCFGFCGICLTTTISTTKNNIRTTISPLTTADISAQTGQSFFAVELMWLPHKLQVVNAMYISFFIKSTEPHVVLLLPYRAKAPPCQDVAKWLQPLLLIILGCFNHAYPVACQNHQIMLNLVHLYVKTSRQVGVLAIRSGKLMSPFGIHNHFGKQPDRHGLML